MNEYSIWLSVTGKLEKELSKIILDLSLQEKTLLFSPHLTLVGGITGTQAEVIAKTQLLATRTKPLPLHLGEVSFSTTYFQSVLLRVKVTAHLMDANLAAKQLFLLPENVYMPHISLLYGIDTMQKREEIARKIVVTETSFLVSHIELIEYDPSAIDPASWLSIGTYPLSAN